jgi:hypothetical protein
MGAVLVDGRRVAISQTKDYRTVHVDWSKSAVGNGAAQCTGKCKARVEVKTLWFFDHGLLGSCGGSEGRHCCGGVEVCDATQKRLAVNGVKECW